MTIDSKTVRFIHTAVFASLLPMPVLAQSPPSGERPILEELIVTAQKREQNLQDVPIGVSLLSGRAMAEAQLKNAGELATLIPTLNLQASSGPSTSSFNIRGIGTQTFSPGVDPSVSTMLDGVVMGRSGMAFLDLVDVQRVEVLRGPQGTLYGKNASGGVVHIITKDPTPELSGTVSATAIEEGEYRIDGSVAGPITDTLGYRLTGFGVNDDGYSKNYYNDKKVNDNKAFNVRGKLLWQPTEDLDFMLASDYSKSDCDCTALSVRAILPDPNNPQLQQQLLQQQLPVVPSKHNQDVNNDQRTFTRITSSGYSLTANWDIEGFVLTSISAYRDWENEGIVDFDDSPINPLALTFPGPPKTEQSQFSQEFRLASPPTEWGSYVIGAFYFEQDVDTSNTATAGILEPIVPATTRKSKTSVSSKNAAVFGEVTWNIWQSWRLILGGRYTYDDLSYHTSADKTDGVIFPEPGEARDSLDESDFSPKVAVQWDISDNAMAYASYVRGYKGPAFDTGLFPENARVDPEDPNSPVAGGVVDAETSDSFEIGLKSGWFDNRLIVNMDVYYSKYHDFQAETSLDIGPLGTIVVTNVGAVSTQGVEMDFIALPMENWSISGGIVYTDAQIDDYPNGNCSGGQKARGECPNNYQDLSGGKLPYTPDWKMNLSTDYTLPLEEMPFNLTLGANIRWQDDVLYELSQDPYTKQDAYGIVDLRAIVAGKEEGYRVTAFVKNVFDKNYASLIYANSPALLPNGYIQLVPKYANRMAGIEVRYDF
ncbi:Pesticin receptor [Halioglobus japonicus]|nr:Pesticin receptor [Halioglobus japonicus]